MDKFNFDARFETFTMQIGVEIFWVMTPCSVVVGYQRFGRSCCPHLQAEGNKVLRNFGILPHHFTALRPRSPRL
jgi:hypothetical protein